MMRFRAKIYYSRGEWGELYHGQVKTTRFIQKLSNEWKFGNGGMKRHKVPHVSLLFGHRGVCIFEEVSIICFRGPVVSYGVDENCVFNNTN